MTDSTILKARFGIDLSDALAKLAEAVKLVDTIFKGVYSFDALGYQGQGVVFRSTGRFFRRIKERALTWYSVSVRQGILSHWFNRRTTRSTKAPIRLRGWKGRR